MVSMENKLFPLLCYLCATLLAQGVKPFLIYFKTKKFNWRYAFASGGYPSSHTSGVAALGLAVGLCEGFNSTIFSVTAAVCIIVSYDAANIRYYAGKNITLTKQLINDLVEEELLDLDDPIYFEKMKEVLGHKWSEVAVGAAFGFVVTLLMYFIFRG